MGDFREWVIFEDTEKLTLKGKDRTKHANRMNASDINFHATTVGFVGKAKARKEDAALIELVKRTIGEKICVLTTGITDTPLTEEVNGKSWIGLYDNVEYSDDIAVEAAYDLGQQGKKAIVISYDELVAGVDYLRPLAWAHVPTEAVEDYRKTVYGLFKAEYAPISEMMKDKVSAYSSTGISGAEISIGGTGTSSKLYTFERKRGKLF